MKKVYTLKEDIYGIGTILFLGTWKQFQIYIKRKYKVELEDNNTAGKFLSIEDPKIGFFTHYIWMPKFNWLISEQDTLCHECIHATFDTMKRCNIPFTCDNNEAFAYLNSYYYSGLLLALNVEYKKNEKKKAKKKK